MQSEGYRTAASGFPTASNASFQASYTPTIPGGGLPVRNGIVYMESHDEQWMMYQNRTAGNSAGGYSVRDFGTALDRQKLAAAFFFTVPGPRLMWQFEELGYGGGPGECLVNTGVTCPAGTPGRINAKPIRWDYVAAGAQPARGSYTGGALTPATDAERAQRLRLFKTFQALIGLRSDYAIFRDPATQVQPTLDARTVRLITLSLPGAPAGAADARVRLRQLRRRPGPDQPHRPGDVVRLLRRHRHDAAGWHDDADARPRRVPRLDRHGRAVARAGHHHGRRRDGG